MPRAALPAPGLAPRRTGTRPQRAARSGGVGRRPGAGGEPPGWTCSVRRAAPGSPRPEECSLRGAGRPRLGRERRGLAFPRSGVPGRWIGGLEVLPAPGHLPPASELHPLAPGTPHPDGPCQGCGGNFGKNTDRRRRAGFGPTMTEVGAGSSRSPQARSGALPFPPVAPPRPPGVAARPRRRESEG